MFAPSTLHNAVSMRDGHTYQTHLDELARYLDEGKTIKEPMQEVAYGRVRVFLEVDGAFTEAMEDTMHRLVLAYRDGDHTKYETYDPSTWRRCVLSFGGRFHVVYPGLVMDTADYCDLVQKMRAEYPTIDKTCNPGKAWLRFPTAPKPHGPSRPYTLHEGTTYRDAFINATVLPTRRPAKVSTRTVVGDEDKKRITAKWPGTVLAKKGYIDTKRTYFSRGKAWCDKGQRYHAKRPVVFHVTDEAVWQGKCEDPLCLK